MLTRLTSCLLLVVLLNACASEQEKTANNTSVIEEGISALLPPQEMADIVTPEPTFPDILIIELLPGDSIFVEGEYCTKEKFKEKITYFYEANRLAQKDPTMPAYFNYSLIECNRSIDSVSQLIVKNGSNDQQLVYEKKMWQNRKQICELSKELECRIISDRALIQIKSEAATEYGTYTGANDMIKAATADLRRVRCKEFGWGDYDDIEPESDKMKCLQIMVPERVIEARIEI